MERRGEIMRKQQLRKIAKCKNYYVSDRAYVAILYIAWRKYCNEKNRMY